MAVEDVVNRLTNLFTQNTILLAEIKQRHAHGQVAWQLQHRVQELVCPPLLITRFAAANLLHGASARAFLVRSLHRLHFWLCRAVRVRTARFRHWRSQGVCPREVFRGKANGKN